MPQKDSLTNPSTDVPIKIGLLDHMGFGNMGDAALHESFIQNIKTRLPNVLLVSFSQNPGDTCKRHNIPCYPIEWNNPGYLGTADKMGEAQPNRISQLKGLLD